MLPKGTRIIAVGSILTMLCFSCVVQVKYEGRYSGTVCVPGGRECEVEVTTSEDTVKVEQGSI